MGSAQSWVLTQPWWVSECGHGGHMGGLLVVIAVWGAQKAPSTTQAPWFFTTSLPLHLLSIHQSIHPFFHPPTHLSINPPIHPINPFIHPTIHLPIFIHNPPIYH